MKSNRFFIRVLWFLIAGFLFVSCKKNEEKKSDEGRDADYFHLADTVKTVAENPKITEFKTFVWQLDSMDLASAKKATDRFREIFAGQPVTLCDSAYVVFQSLCDTLELNQNNLHQNDTTDYDPLFIGDPALAPKKLKEFSKSLTDNGFKLSRSEGFTYIELDRNFVARNFFDLVSPAMKSYLVELQKENKEGFAIDGKLAITPRQLVDRTVWYENFIAANPGFVFLNNCRDYQKAYLTYLLCGYQNSTLYEDSERKELSDYFFKAYSYLNSKYRSTETAKLVQPYFEALKKKDAGAVQSLLKSYHIKGLIYSQK